MLQTMSDYRCMMFDYGFRGSSFKVSYYNSCKVQIVVKKQFIRYLLLKKKIMKYVDYNRGIGVEAELLFAIK